MYKAAQYCSCICHENKFLLFLTPFASLWWERSKDQPPLCPENFTGLCVGIGEGVYLCFVWNAISVIYFQMSFLLLHAPYSNVKRTNLPLQLIPYSHHCAQRTTVCSIILVMPPGTPHSALFWWVKRNLLFWKVVNTGASRRSLQTLFQCIKTWMLVIPSSP